MLETLGKRKTFEETNKVLNDLSVKYKLVIGSTSDTAPLLEDVKNYKICINDIYTSESLQIYKPKKEFYNKILMEIGYNSNEVFFVGDSLIDDVFGPQNVGIYSVLIDRKNNYDKSSDIIPDKIICNLSELLTLLF
jgi:HAD superfamily hydrolase (TIGR01549 family)